MADGWWLNLDFDQLSAEAGPINYPWKPQTSPPDPWPLYPTHTAWFYNEGYPIAGYPRLVGIDNFDNVSGLGILSVGSGWAVWGLRDAMPAISHFPGTEDSAAWDAASTPEITTIGVVEADVEFHVSLGEGGQQAGPAIFSIYSGAIMQDLYFGANEQPVLALRMGYHSSSVGYAPWVNDTPDLHSLRLDYVETGHTYQLAKHLDCDGTDTTAAGPGPNYASVPRGPAPRVFSTAEIDGKTIRVRLEWKNGTFDGNQRRSDGWAKVYFDGVLAAEVNGGSGTDTSGPNAGNGGIGAPVAVPRLTYVVLGPHVL
jgi:hypothetical protein